MCHYWHVEENLCSVCHIYRWELEPVSQVIWQELGMHLWEMHPSIHRKAHAIHSHLGATRESPIGFMCIFLDCGRKQKYLEKNNKNKGRTCSLHPVRPHNRIQSQDLFAGAILLLTNSNYPQIICSVL